VSEPNPYLLANRGKRINALVNAIDETVIELATRDPDATITDPNAQAGALAVLISDVWQDEQWRPYVKLSGIKGWPSDETKRGVVKVYLDRAAQFVSDPEARDEDPFARVG
jgi:hypothetical protein